MKLFGAIKFFGFLILSHQTLCASLCPCGEMHANGDDGLAITNSILEKTEAGRHSYSGCPFSKKTPFGSVGFAGGPSDWYSIDTHSYPETVLLSQNRNRSTVEGALYPSPTGFTIGETGSYWINIVAILQNTSPDYTAFIPVYLAIDDVFDPDSTSQIGAVISLPTNVIATAQGTGILKDVPAGTRLSLVATNAGSPFPQPITVVGWAITLIKIK